MVKGSARVGTKSLFLGILGLLWPWPTSLEIPHPNPDILRPCFAELQEGFLENLPFTLSLK